jgi:two-component system LytT family sensor kinase
VISRPAARFHLVNVGVWGLLALLETGKDVVASATGASQAPLFTAVYQNAVWWGGWAALTPIVAWLSGRASLIGPQRARAVAVHGLAAVSAAFVHGIASAAAFSLAPADPDRWPGIAAVAVRLIQGFLLLDVITYAAIVAIVHAIDYAARLRHREQEAAELALTTSELERALAAARLDTLRAQLNPHFLFNTLNSISGLVRRGEREGAVGMLAKLGDLLRESLALGAGQLVTVAGEIAVLDRYLAIEEIRFGERLAVRYDIDPVVESALVPCLVLQPVVENAIRHGIARSPTGGSLDVSAREDERGLVLMVENRPRVAAAPRRGPVREGIGLANTRERLAQHYRDAARLELVFLPDGGCRVTITLPATLECRPAPPAHRPQPASPTAAVAR